MAQRHRFSRKQHKNAIQQRRDAPPRAAASSLERKPPTVYGKPFVLLEDESKNTFEYAQGAWIPYSMTIAECKQDCQVKELPQKVNGKTRYEIRSPVPTAT
jgi:hypothetical protein